MHLAVCCNFRRSAPPDALMLTAIPRPLLAMHVNTRAENDKQPAYMTYSEWHPQLLNSCKSVKCADGRSRSSGAAPWGPNSQHVQDLGKQLSWQYKAIKKRTPKQRNLCTRCCLSVCYLPRLLLVPAAAGTWLLYPRPFCASKPLTQQRVHRKRWI